MKYIFFLISCIIICSCNAFYENTTEPRKDTNDQQLYYNPEFLRHFEKLLLNSEQNKILPSQLKHDERLKKLLEQNNNDDDIMTVLAAMGVFVIFLTFIVISGK